MNKYLLIILTFAAYSLKSQNIDFEDINFKTFVLHSGVDLDLNGEISINEALQVTDELGQGEWLLPDSLKTFYSTNFSYPYEHGTINSIDGIEYFTNMSRFDLRYHKIDSVDLSDIHKLEWLMLEHNSIKYINLTECDSLSWFNFADNDLTSLDISQNLKLELVLGGSFEHYKLKTVCIPNGWTKESYSLYRIYDPDSFDGNSIEVLSDCNTVTGIEPHNELQLKYRIVGNDLIVETSNDITNTLAISINGSQLDCIYRITKSKIIVDLSKINSMTFIKVFTANGSETIVINEHNTIYSK